MAAVTVAKHPPNAPVYLWFYSSARPCTSSGLRLHGGCGTTKWERMRRRERERESVMAYWDCWSGEMTNKDIFIDSMQDSHTHMRTRTHTHTLTWTLRVTYSRLLWFLFSSCRHKSIIHLKMTHFLPRGFWQFCGASSGELFLINADFTRKQK